MLLVQLHSVLAWVAKEFLWLCKTKNDKNSYHCLTVETDALMVRISISHLVGCVQSLVRIQTFFLNLNSHTKWQLQKYSAFISQPARISDGCCKENKQLKQATIASASINILMVARYLENESSMTAP